MKTITDIATELRVVLRTNPRVSRRIELTVCQFVTETRTVYPCDVLPETLMGFCQALLDKGFATDTVYKKLQLMKRVFTYAVNRKLIDVSPFMFFRFPVRPRPALVQLEESELAALQEMRGKLGNRLNRVLDIFLFTCYTGLSYCDVWTFTPGAIVHREGLPLMIGKRVKSNETYIVPWLPQAAAIAADYGYSFKVISNQRMNKYLKEVAKLCGVSKRLTTKCGRKTFGQAMFDRGHSEDAVARMLGHNSPRMTVWHYARVGERRIINEHKRLCA